MSMFSYILLVLLLAAVSTSNTSCTNGSSLSYIENTLASLSAKFSTLSCSSIESSLASATGLLQLSLLRKLLDLNDDSSQSPNGNLEGLAILNRMEELLNNTAARLDAIKEETAARLDTIESKLNQLSLEDTPHSLMESRLLSSIERNTRLLQTHDNLTSETLDHLDDKLPNLPRSCDEVIKKWPNIASGYYRLADAYGHARQVYCSMESLCNSEGGWIRVSHLDMRNSNEKCPKGLRLYVNGTVRACGRPTSSTGSCPGITFPVEFKYTKVCGKVIGYQKGIPDGTWFTPKVDGVVLTHGSSRSHLWSFIVSPFELMQLYNGVDHVFCPCSPAGKAPPSYIGDHYFCESGDRDTTISGDLDRLYTDDPLWDGKQCGVFEHNCCHQSPISPPWFYRSLNHSTTDYIEMRLCFNEGTHDEDSPVGQYDIYVK